MILRVRGCIMSCLLLLGLISGLFSASANAQCSAVLAEAPPLGEPAHSAQAQVLADNDCPVISKVSAALVASGERVASRSYYDEALANPPLVFPVRSNLSLPNVAGIYQIEWTTEFVTGESQVMTQTFALPCPAPGSVTTRWNDSDSTVTFTPSFGDVCEGQTTATLDIRDITGGSIVENVTATFSVDNPDPSVVELQLPRLDGERRYAGEILLENESQQVTRVPVEFVTGCGAMSPSATISNGRILGSVEASDCQYPITMNISVVHSSGEAIRSFTATLSNETFDFPIPDFDSWPAGDFNLDIDFVGTTARATQTVGVAIACEDPAFSEPSLTLGDTANIANVNFALSGRNVCQGATRVSVQVRDVNRVVVFNRSLDLEAGSLAENLTWPFRGTPGSTYDVELNAQFGVSFQQSVERSRRTAYECTAPEVLELGYSNAEGTHAAALLAMSQCNAPASAKLVVRNEVGRIVAESDPQILQDLGASFATLEPTSLGHLDSGKFTAELTVADNRGRTAIAKAELSRDVSGPEIAFNRGAALLEPGQTPDITSLDELVLTFSDSSDPLPSFEEFQSALEPFPSGGAASFHQVDGEVTPQIWIGGTVDAPREEADWGFVGVLVRNQTGDRWISRIVRTYVPYTDNELTDFHPSISRTGFRAVSRIETLLPGNYTIEGVVVGATDGTRYLIAGTGSFSVSTLAGRRHESLLRRGVTEIPVALRWETDNTAQLERITSVPDGDYTLSVVGRDSYGNPSDVYNLSFSLVQDKATARLVWPAIAGYTRTVQHRFHVPGVARVGPLRVLFRRTGGYGEIRINGERVTEQTVETILTPDAAGMFSMALELVNADVDGQFVLHADSTEARPLELSVSTFHPEFSVQRRRGDNLDVLTVEHDGQECRHVIFDDLSRVSVRVDEVVCAVRLNIPGTSVLSTNDDRTEVRLPPGVSTEAMYEEGFVRANEGQVVFQATRQIELAEIQSYSSTPQLEFVPLPQWRNRSANGAYLSAVGNVIAGHVVIRGGAEAPTVTINGEAVSTPAQSTGEIRIPIRTSITQIGAAQQLQVKAFYPSTPDLDVNLQYEFFAVPEEPLLRPVSGSLVSPNPLEMVLQLSTTTEAYSPDRHGTYEARALRVIDRNDPTAVHLSPEAEMTENGRLSVALGALPPGSYRLTSEIVSNDSRFREILAPLATDATFEVVDGSAVAAKLFTFRDADKIPFFGQISVDYVNDKRRGDVRRVAWEVSEDGQTFVPFQCCGSSIDFALTDPGTRFYRAQLTNRHSEVSSYTDPIELRSYIAGELRVVGPRQTFRGFPAKYQVAGLPDDREVLWRVVPPNSDEPIVQRGSTLEIGAEETGTYFVEVIADTGTDSPDHTSALRTFFALETTWPRIPASVINGPSDVEYGKSNTFTVSHPPIFSDRGNSEIVRVGEWELPDGTRSSDDEWVEFTLRSIAEGFETADVYYHSWIDGDRTTLTTAVHRIKPIEYDWPDWELKVATNSLEPPAILRLSVTPESWQEWMGLGSYPITTFWELPSHIRVIERTPTEAIVFAADDRPFHVTARITDPRGNVTELRRGDIRPVNQIPFEISLRAVAERALQTAPIEVVVHVDAIVLPRGQEIDRVAFYLDGLYRGVTDGSPFEIQIRNPGEHRLRAIASIGTTYTTDDELTLSIGNNHKANCTITPIGDFRLNGLAKATCEDPDGHMVEYRWYADGQLLTEAGTRVTLSRAQLLSIGELSLIAVDNAGLETTARYVPPRE